MNNKIPLVASVVALLIVISVPAALGATGCVRGTPVDASPLKVVSGTGYTTSGSTDAFVPVKELNSLGSGTFVNYQFTFTNGDSGCGSTSRYQISVVGTGVNSQLVSNNAMYQFSVSGATSSLGVPVSVQSAPGGTYIVNAPAGGKTTVNVKVEAASDLQSGVKGFGGVTITATNLDAQAEGVSERTQGSGQITVSVVSACVNSKPTVRIDPAGGRSGFAGDQEDYLVTVRNENTGGCEPLTFTITQAGVQNFDQPCTDPLCSNSVIADTSAPRWSFVARLQSGTSIIDVPFTSGGVGNTFNYGSGTLKYNRFAPSQTIRFTLGSSDAGVTRSSSACTNCEKTLILKVKSYVLDKDTGPISIALCVDQGGICGFSGYNVLNHFETKPSTTDADLGITDSKLNNPQVSTSTSSGGTSSSGGTVSGSGTSNGGSSSTSTSNNACVTCTLQARKGWNFDTDTCMAGDVSGSTDGSASIAKGNWIYYPTLTSKNRLLPSTDTRLKSSISCDAVSSSTSNDNLGTLVGTFTTGSLSCNKCSQFGYTEGLCYQGFQCVSGCVVQNGCTQSSISTSTSTTTGGTSPSSSASSTSSCSKCADFGYTEGQCNSGFQCVNNCVVQNGCTKSSASTTTSTSTSSTSTSSSSTATSSGRVSVTTDKTSYRLGETVHVSGNGDANQFVTGELFDPNGNLRDVFQTTATSSSTYSDTFVLSTDPIWNVPGIWKIVIDADGAVTQGAITITSL